MHNQALSNFCMSHVGEILNAGVCLFVLFFNLAFYGVLSKVCSERTDAAGAIKPWAILPWMFRRWSWAWLIWFTIYSLMLVIAWNTWNAQVGELVLFVLSDLASVCLLSMCLALTRGESGILQKLRSFNLAALLGVLVWDVFLAGFGWLVTEGDESAIFLRHWSAALSILTPLVLGRVFLLRYGTQSIWWLAFSYGLVRVFLYGSLLLPPDRCITITTSEEVTFDKDVSAFVHLEKQEVDHFEYVITCCSTTGELTGKKIRKLLANFPDIEVVSNAWAYVQLRFQDLVFAILALLKLALGAQVLTTVRMEPTKVGALMSYCAHPESGTSLVPSWKSYSWPLYGLLMIMVVLVVGLYGKEALFALVPILVALGVVLKKTKGGASLLGALEGPNEDA